MSYRRLSAVISILTFVLAVSFLGLKGLNLGVDFTGGTIMEVKYAEQANIQSIRNTLAEINLQDAQVQNFGTAKDVLIRLPLRNDLSIAELSEKVLASLKEKNSSVEIMRVESVGAQIGEELYEDGALAILFVCLGIVLYLSFSIL